MLHIWMYLFQWLNEDKNQIVSKTHMMTLTEKHKNRIQYDSKISGIHIKQV